MKFTSVALIFLGALTATAAPVADANADAGNGLASGADLEARRHKYSNGDGSLDVGLNNGDDMPTAPGMPAW